MTRSRLESQQPSAWQHAVIDCLQQLFQQHHAAEVESIAVDGTSGTLLLSDTHGQVISDVLMYNDAANRQYLEKIDAPADSPALSATAGLAKVLQLADGLKSPEALVQHQADWLTGWLCDHYGYSDENNVLKTGYDLVKRQWPEWVSKAIPAGIQLPGVMVPGDKVGHAGKLLQSLGVSAKTRVLAGTTDSTAAFLATGVCRLDRGVTTLGSTLVVKQLSRQPVTDSARGIYSHRLGDAWLTGGASNSGGNVLDHFFSKEQLQQLSEQMNPAQPSGLDYYPLVKPGERFPLDDPQLAPRLSPRPDDHGLFLQGIMEGIAAIEARGYQTLNSLGTMPVRQVVTSGGGACNPMWTRIRERVLGIPVHMAVHTEAAYGSARLARHGSGLFDSYSQT